MVLKQLADEIFYEKKDELRQIIREELERLQTPTPQQNNPYLQTNEACKYLGCSPNWLSNFCIRYNIIPKKISGKNYYLRSEIDKVFVN